MNLHRLIHRPLARAAGALACAAVALVAAAPARAEPVFAITPTPQTASNYFVLKTAPGSVLSRSVKVTNVGDSAGAVRLYAVDATTGKTTGAVYLGDDRPRRGVGAWVALDRSRLTLRPGQSEVVGFSLKVPDAVRGGQHLGGLVADAVAPQRAKSEERGDGNFRVDVRRLTVTAVQVELPGRSDIRMDMTGLRAGGKPGYQEVLVKMENPGNRMIKPTLEVQISDSDAEPVLERTTKLDTFLPQTAIEYPVPVLKQGLPEGTYRGNVVLRLGDRVLDRFSGEFDVSDEQVEQIFGGDGGPAAPGGGSPWVIALLGGLAMAGLLGAMEHYRRKAKRLSRATPR